MLFMIIVTLKKLVVWKGLYKYFQIVGMLFWRDFFLVWKEVIGNVWGLYVWFFNAIIFFSMNGGDRDFWGYG